MKNQYIGGNCLRNGDLDSLQIYRGVGLREKEGVGIFEGWLIPQCTLWFSVNDSEFEKSKCLNMSL